jgi:hypothetical protein
MVATSDYRFEYKLDNTTGIRCVRLWHYRCVIMMMMMMMMVYYCLSKRTPLPMRVAWGGGGGGGPFGRGGWNRKRQNFIKKLVQSPICSANCREMRQNFTKNIWGSVRKVELDPELS